MQDLSVYIHIPFCVRKCDYCDFLSAPASREKMSQYVEALKKEIRHDACKYQNHQIRTVFFGGGTPSILEGEDIVQIIDTLKQYYDMTKVQEITIEMNPATATKEKMLLWKKAGVNRISIGLQSANDEELKMIGRIHCYQDFLDSYYMAREADFQNINVDLMSGLPGQNLQTWEKTLVSVLALKPEHISAYSLIVEEGTRLYERLDEYPPIPEEELDRQMYRRTKEILKQNGYERYEISNYAKKGYECVHNIVYWQRGDYAGFGLGASSMVADVRWKNTDSFSKYLGNSENQKMIQEEIEELSETECMEEFMFLGLRMMKGILKKDFEQCFHKTVEQVYGNVITKWEKQKMLVADERTIHLSDTGIDVSNVIFSDFLS